MAPVPGIGEAAGGAMGLRLDLLQNATKATKAADAASEGSGTSDFAAVLKDKLTSLNTEQADAAKATTDMATGRVDDVAQTMLRIEQANVSLQMATQVRNKVIEAYQDILRMQM
jgi:flagellar hook-basal body complex protein FliE